MKKATTRYRSLHTLTLGNISKPHAVAETIEGLRLNAVNTTPKG